MEMKYTLQEILEEKLDEANDVTQTKNVEISELTKARDLLIEQIEIAHQEMLDMKDHIKLVIHSTPFYGQSASHIFTMFYGY